MHGGLQWRCIWSVGHSVTLVPRRIEQALALASRRENTEYLPEIRVARGIQIGYEPAPVLMEAEAIFLACPAKALRPFAGSSSISWRMPGN